MHIRKLEKQQQENMELSTDSSSTEEASRGQMDELKKGTTPCCCAVQEAPADRCCAGTVRCHLSSVGGCGQDASSAAGATGEPAGSARCRSAAGQERTADMVRTPVNADGADVDFQVMRDCEVHAAERQALEEERASLLQRVQELEAAHLKLAVSESFGLHFHSCTGVRADESLSV